MAQCTYCGAGICDCKASAACDSCAKKIKQIKADPNLTPEEREKKLKEMYAHNK